MNGSLTICSEAKCTRHSSPGTDTSLEKASKCERLGICHLTTRPFIELIESRTSGRPRS